MLATDLCVLKNYGPKETDKAGVVSKSLFLTTGCAYKDNNQAIPSMMNGKARRKLAREPAKRHTATIKKI